MIKNFVHYCYDVNLFATCFCKTINFIRVYHQISSYNTKNILTRGSFLEHLVEPKLNMFLSYKIHESRTKLVSNWEQNMYTKR